MNRITLKVVPPESDPSSLSHLDALLAILQGSLNSQRSVPDMVAELRAYRGGQPFRYREQLIDYIKGSAPQPLDEAIRRMELIDIISELKDGDVLELKDSEHATLKSIMADFRIPADRTMIRFFQDVNKADDSLPQILSEDLEGSKESEGD